MLKQLTYDLNKESISLYQHNDLVVFHNVSKLEIEIEIKQIVKRFEDCELSITIQCNLKMVDYLDVTFDLYNLCKLYRKPK